MFKKYPEIENSYREKTIEMAMSYDPRLKHCKWCVEEKIDGSNIQFVFTPNNSNIINESNIIDIIWDNIKIGSRNNYLDKNANFQGANWKQLFDNYINDFGFIYGICCALNAELILYGELFGKGIQKRIYYGEDHYIRFFDMVLNGKVVSQKYFESTIGQFCPNIFVNVLKIGSFEECLNYSNEFPSIFSPNGDLAEGYVMKPYDIESTFYLKNKSEKFGEKMKQKTIKNKEYPDHVNFLKSTFNTFINENRVLSVFSKEGVIKEPSEIGKYIVWIMEDAKKDFLKENNLPELSKDEEKYIFNAGKHIVKILEKYL